MTKRISTLALMVCLAGSIAVAQGKTKAVQTTDELVAMTVKDGAPNPSGQEAKNDCPPTKSGKKIKRDAKPAPQNQKDDEEYQRFLQGTYGG